MITQYWAMMFGVLSLGMGVGYLLFKFLSYSYKPYESTATWMGVLSWVSAWFSIYILTRL